MKYKQEDAHIPVYDSLVYDSLLYDSKEENMNNMSNTKRILALIAIFVSTIAVMADLAITPVIGMIYGAYPDNMGAVNYIVSGPMLIVVVVSLLTPYLFRFMDKKLVFIIASIIFAIGAIGGVAVNTPGFICFTRTLVGIGEGAINVVGVSYIADLYESQEIRSRISGYYNSALSLAGMVLSYVAGYLATDGNWTSVYKVYWVAIPIAILVILFIPSVKPDASAATVKKTSTGKKEPLGWRFIYMNICWFVVNLVLGASILYYLSSYIFEFGLGDSSFSGTATAVKSVCGILVGLVYGNIVAGLKRFTPTVTFAVAAVGMLIMLAAPATWTVLIIGTITGLTYKVWFSYSYGHGWEIVPASRVDDAVSISTAVYGLGSFACTYFYSFIAGALKTESIVPVWYVCIGILAVLFVVDLIVISIEKKQFPAG